jgi:hypothetical protein
VGEKLDRNEKGERDGHRYRERIIPNRDSKVLRSWNKVIFLDGRMAGGVRFLLWGEPGRRR